MANSKTAASEAKREESTWTDFVQVRGARQNNLKNIDVDIPRNAFVVFTGVSGSGKSSLAFGTIYAEAQRRYFDSIAPYARRLLNQLPAPHVTDILGLPTAIALQQRRADPGSRSSVGTITKLSNIVRMLFSRAGVYPTNATERLDSDAFSANTVVGACENCHGIGIVHSVSEKSLVPDPTLTIREGAIAAWPGAWQGKNLRDILATLGYDVDKSWKNLPKKDRDWILFTDEKPVVTVYAEREAHRIQRPYQGTYMSAAKYVLHTFANTESATLRKRAESFMETAPCETCGGKRLKKQSLAVRFLGKDISEATRMPLSSLAGLLEDAIATKKFKLDKGKTFGDADEAALLMSSDLLERIKLISELGLDYLSLSRPSATLSAGELQRLRLTTQLRSGLCGVVYILDEPSAGLHPSDTESLLKLLKQLQAAGNSVFIVEHEIDVIRKADWLVDMGPAAGENGGNLIYSGPPDGLPNVQQSLTGRYLDEQDRKVDRHFREADGLLRLSNVTRHNLKNLTAEFPLRTLTAVTGVSGSGKSTLVSMVLHEAIAARLGAGKNQNAAEDEEQSEEADENDSYISGGSGRTSIDNITIIGAEKIRRLVAVDQKPIGRTPRSNLATYTGLFDHIRKRFAATDDAKKRRYNASRFSFNVSGGRCSNCEGEGFVSVELLFLPTVYSPCTVCHGTRYNEDTLSVRYNGLNIADVLNLTVESAIEFFNQDPTIGKALKTVTDVGLGYLRLGQPATELSGGEAQRIKLATELQRAQAGDSLYLLDEPTTGLHPADTEKLMRLLHALVDAGNTVIVVEHDMDVITNSDWVIDLGPGAGDAGGTIVAAGQPTKIANSKNSITAKYIRARLTGGAR